MTPFDVLGGSLLFQAARDLGLDLKRFLFELGQLIHQLVLFVRELLHTLRELAVVLLRVTERGLQVSLLGV